MLASSSDDELRAEFQRHMDFEREIHGRSDPEMAFFAVNGFWPESVGDRLPPGIEFTVRGIKTIVTTQWEDEGQKTWDTE